MEKISKKLAFASIASIFVAAIRFLVFPFFTQYIYNPNVYTTTETFEFSNGISMTKTYTEVRNLELLTVIADALIPLLCFLIAGFICKLIFKHKKGNLLLVASSLVYAGLMYVMLNFLFEKQNDLVIYATLLVFAFIVLFVYALISAPKSSAQPIAYTSIPGFEGQQAAVPVPNPGTVAYQSTLPTPDALSAAILNAIRPKLKAPITAVLCSIEEMTITQNHGEYEIQGYVNSQNSYGAMVATDFTVKAVYANNSWVITNSKIGVKLAKNFAKNFTASYIAFIIFGIVMSILLYFLFSTLISGSLM